MGATSDVDNLIGVITTTEEPAWPTPIHPFRNTGNASFVVKPGTLDSKEMYA